MQAPVLSGPQYLREGLKLVLSPSLRLFVLLPLAVNLLLFGGLIWFAGHEFSLWVDALMPSLPDWLSFLSYILWPLFVALVVLMVFFTFTMLANVIAAPFNGFLAEKVEVVVRGQDTFPAFSWGELVAMVPRTFGREMRKLGYFLPRAIGLFILSFIPVVNVVAAPLWLVFGVWMMAIQYIDYPADNNKMSWQDMLAWLRQKRWQSLGFGGITYLALMIPGVNVLMMPAAVAGATLFWVRERSALAQCRQAAPRHVGAGLPAMPACQDQLGWKTAPPHPPPSSPLPDLHDHPAGIGRQGQALFGLALAGVDDVHRRLGQLLVLLHHLGDFFGGAAGTRSQLAHFVGDHGKATALLAGAGGLDGRVERQQVGLAGDVADGLDDRANHLGLLVQRLDAVGGVLHRAFQPAHHVHGLGHHVGGLARAASVSSEVL
jgi:CysZ protein